MADEEQFRIASPVAGLTLFLRHLAPPGPAPGVPRVVLYVHGATYPSALSIAHRLDGHSWRDDLAAAGFHVWGLDFLGFGGSDHYPGMAMRPDNAPTLGRARDASEQIESAVRFICERHPIARINIIAHSWGTIATGAFAARCPDLVERLVFFGPIASRPGAANPTTYPAWWHVTAQDQWERFVAGAPRGVKAPMSRRHFEVWAESYLDSDPESRTRSPASVRVPNGPMHDIAAAWSGQLPYDPRLIQAPILIVRGEWDDLVTDSDARCLYDSLEASPDKRDVKISRATHQMHLEESRQQLYRETRCFLDG